MIKYLWILPFLFLIENADSQTMLRRAGRWALSAAPPATTDSVKLFGAASSRVYPANTTGSFSFDAGSGSNRLLLVQVLYRDGDNSTRRPTISATYNSVAMTRDTVYSRYNNYDTWAVRIFYLAASATGSNTLEVTADSSMIMTICASAWYNAPQTSPLADFLGETVLQTDADIVCSNTEVRGIVIAGRGEKYAAAYTLSSGTELHSDYRGTAGDENWWIAAYTRPTGSTTTTTFASLPSQYDSQYTFRIKAIP